MAIKSYDWRFYLCHLQGLLMILQGRYFYIHSFIHSKSIVSAYSMAGFVLTLQIQQYLK